MTEEQFEQYCKLLEESKEAAKRGDVKLAKEKLEEANKLLASTEHGGGGIM